MGIIWISLHLGEYIYFCMLYCYSRDVFCDSLYPSRSLSLSLSAISFSLGLTSTPMNYVKITEKPESS